MLLRLRDKLPPEIMELFKLVVMFTCCVLVRAKTDTEQRHVASRTALAEDAGTLRQADVQPLTCGEASSAAEMTFTNPNYPAAETGALGSCTLKISHVSENICQIRLDFSEFTLTQPNYEGVCDIDFLQIPEGPSYIPTICGDNSGQHMYVTVSDGNCNTVINVDTAAVGSKWNINIKQIKCDSIERAPSGCLQYFNSTTGVISSFNFNPESTATSSTRQLAKQGYGVCINSLSGYCSVTYQQASGSTFSLSADPTALPPDLPSEPVVGSDCSGDYLLVPNGELEVPVGVTPRANTSVDRFCGLSFPTVKSSIPPFNVYLVTDDDEGSSGDFGNQGFKLAYRMNAC
ncbi:CUB domain [Trinorchestia longiramus]|nr:CUB domain [Trinorchestia longiramus]